MRITAGEVLLLPKGSKIAWHQRERLRKLYLTFDADPADTAAPSPAR